jgi:hypothetical protein
MPIVGNLNEFPLPEVLNLIGTRTGRMQLLDIPEAGVLLMDLWEGHIISLQVAGVYVEDPTEVIRKLSHVVEGGYGMFEFRLMPPEDLRGSLRLALNRVAMDLCFEVDNAIGTTRALIQANPTFVLISEHDIWLEPELQAFFNGIRGHLASGIDVKSASRIVGIEPPMAYANFNKLLQLGMVEILKTSATNGANTTNGRRAEDHSHPERDNGHTVLHDRNRRFQQDESVAEAPAENQG